MKKAIVYYKPKHTSFTDLVYSEPKSEILCDKIQQENKLLYFIKKCDTVRIINIDCIKQIIIR